MHFHNESVSHEIGYRRRSNYVSLKNNYFPSETKLSHPKCDATSEF